MTKVRDRAHLRTLIADGTHEFLIALSPAGLVSRKELSAVGNGRYQVFHGIDGRTEILSWRQLCAQTNIGLAIDRGVFYADD